MASQLVIDLGTCHTVAVLHRDGQAPRPVLFDGSPLLPSGVYLQQDGTLWVGRDAERLSLLSPSRFEPYPKRCVDDGTVLLGDAPVPVVELLAAPLRRVRAEITAAGDGEVPAVTTLTCPADWGTRRREVLRAAARAAGLGEVWLVDEPVAAATYFLEVLRQPVPAGGSLLVFDFGGGTLDVSVVRRDPDALRVTAVGGLDDLGGVDVDAALVGHLGQLVALRAPRVWQRLASAQSTAELRDRRAFWNEVRAAKEMLSRAASAPVQVPGSDDAMHLTREELERVAGPLIDRAVDETRRVLDRSGAGPGGLAGILLVGGSSRIPLVASRLHARFGLAPTVPEQPELPVALGGLLRGDPRTAPPGTMAGPATPMSAAPYAPAPVSPGVGPPRPPAPAPGIAFAPGYPPVPGSPMPGGPTSPPAAGAAVPMGARPPGTGSGVLAAPAGLLAPGPVGPAGAAPGMAAGPGMAAPGMTGPGMAAPGMAGPGLVGPGLAAPGMDAPVGVDWAPPARRSPWRRVVAVLVSLAVVGGGGWTVTRLYGSVSRAMSGSLGSLSGNTGGGGTGSAGLGKGSVREIGTPVTMPGSGPVAVAVGTGAVYYAVGDTQHVTVTAVSGTDGSRKWQQQLALAPSGLALHVVGDLLLVDATRTAGGKDMRAALTVSDGKTLWTGDWSDRTDQGYLGTDAIVDWEGFDTIATLRVNLRTGKTVWSHPAPSDVITAERRTGVPLRWPSSPPATGVGSPASTTALQESLDVDPGVVVELNSENGTGDVLDAAHGTEKVRSRPLPLDDKTELWTVFDGYVIGALSDSSTPGVAAYRLGDLSQAWTYKVQPGAEVKRVHPCGQHQVCASVSGTDVNSVYALDTTKGTTVWKNPVTLDWADEPGWLVQGGQVVLGQEPFDNALGGPQDTDRVINQADGTTVRPIGQKVASPTLIATAGRYAVGRVYSSGWRAVLVELDTGRSSGLVDLGTNTSSVPQVAAVGGTTFAVLDGSRRLHLVVGTPA